MLKGSKGTAALAFLIQQERSMRRILTPIVAGLVLAGASSAFAADATGTIKSIDAPSRTVTLDDNRAYAFPASVDVTRMKVGDRVKITFTTDAQGKNNATAVASAT
jgi:hypothetical protein